MRECYTDDRQTLFDDLKAIEKAVVEGERQLAHQEALLVKLKQRNCDLSEASSAFKTMLQQQQLRQSKRLRLLSLLMPKEPRPRHEVDLLLPACSPQPQAGSKSAKRLAASAHCAEVVFGPRPEEDSDGDLTGPA